MKKLKKQVFSVRSAMVASWMASSEIRISALTSLAESVASSAPREPRLVPAVSVPVGRDSVVVVPLLDLAVWARRAVVQESLVMAPAVETSVPRVKVESAASAVIRSSSEHSTSL
jgi:hypothetical protein